MTILEMSNAHLEGYNPNANIHSSKGHKFRDVISKIFSTTRHSSTEAALRHKWVKYYFIAMLRRLYTDPAAPSAFSSLHKLQQAAATPKGKQIKHKKQKTPTQIKEWLETQDAYMLHRPLRKRFPRNPYTVNNIDDVWELDTLDLSSLKKFNNYRYLLQVTDVFSKYLHSVPLRTKTGKKLRLHSNLYRVIQEESAILWEMIVCVILSKKVHINMCPIFDGYGVMGIF